MHGGMICYCYFDLRRIFQFLYARAVDIPLHIFWFYSLHVPPAALSANIQPGRASGTRYFDWGYYVPP
jgi:hypothetical protein